MPRKRHGAPPSGATTGEPPFGFRLSALNECWVNAGLVTPAANESTVSLSAMLGPAALAGATELHIHNYMIDFDLMCQECPAILEVPRVVIVHGDGRPPRSAAVNASAILGSPTARFPKPRVGKLARLLRSEWSEKTRKKPALAASE